MWKLNWKLEKIEINFIPDGQLRRQPELRISIITYCAYIL